MVVNKPAEKPKEEAKPETPAEKPKNDAKPSAAPE